MSDQEHPISLDLVLSESNAPLAVDPRRQELVDTLNPLVPKIAEYQAQVDGMMVRTQTDADNAAALLSAISRDSKEVVGAIKDFKTEAKRRHSLWCDLEGIFTNAFDRAHRTLKQKVITWQQAEQEKALAEQRRLQAIEDERARKEQERLQKLAESRKTPEVKERYEQAAQAVVPTVISVSAPKSGVRMQTRWAVESIDKAEFLEAAVTRRELWGYIKIEESQLVRTKAANSMTEIPGVKFKKVTV